MKTPLHSAALPLVLLAAPACIIHVSGDGFHWGYDGSEYESHSETIAVASFGDAGLTIPECTGDVTIAPSSEGSSIVVQVGEREAGDAHAVFENGKLLVRSASGEQAFLGEVRVRVYGTLAALDVTTRAGDVRLTDVSVERSVKIASGAGDLEVHGIGAPEHVALSSGAGDVEMTRAHFATLEASSGAGDLVVAELEGGDAKFSSGAGDVALRRSHFDRLDASTGVGDISCEEVTYATSDFSSGSGSIPRR